ncbi:MAG TPA: Ku protein [Acidimicrobiales bacterium]|jgi:DNA end-binding protein Ku|nr:Ku protein [Acidimicrobiales bacterium]
MPHSIWTGSVSFGLVNIPVGMYSATEEHTVRFHQFEAGTSDRVRNLRVNERSGKEVAYADIVKGYDLGGESVIVTKEELAAASPERSSTIEISDFVELSEINPIFYRSTYYLAPKGEAAVKPYRLLLQAMAKTNMAGVSLFVMRNKEYLCVVRADRDILVLETLYFADEIRDPIDVLGDLPDAKPSTPKELTMAVELVNALSGPWEPEAYQDTYAEEVKALIARKQKGEDVVVHAEVTKGAPIVDLMDALKQSVDRSRGKAKAGSEPAGSGSSRSKAKKPTVAAKPAVSGRTSRPVAKAAKRPPAGKAAGKTAGRKTAAPARAGASRRKAS